MLPLPLAARVDYRTILRYLRPPEPTAGELWWMLAVVLAMGLLFLTFEIISRRLRRNRTMRKSQDDFGQLALVCQLAPEEIKLLRRLVDTGGVGYPGRLFTSFEFFNDLLEETGPSGGGALGDSDIQGLRIIRNKIFFGERTKLPPVKSTRDLRANQWLHLKSRANGRVFMTPVIEAGSSGLLVVTPSVQGKYLEIKPGEVFDIYFWRDRDASYQFESEAIGQSGGRLLITILKHVDDIERVQRRQYHRIDTSIAVSIVPVTRDELEGTDRKGLRWDQPGLPGHVVNLSGSGLALAARFPLKPNDLVFLELPGDDDGCLPVIAKILGVRKRDTTDEFIMNAEFAGMSADTNEKIFRLIYSQTKYRVPTTA